MKTYPFNPLQRCRLVVFLTMLLFSLVMEGQTYRLLKASNDVSTAADRSEVSNVLTSEDLSRFKFLCATANLVGAFDGQEFTLAKVPGICNRIHSDIPNFKTFGTAWLGANPAMEMVVLDIKKAEDLNQLADVAGQLIQFTHVRYLVLQTFPELYPSASSSMYEARGMELVTPAISSSLNALYDKGIRVFFAAIELK